MGGGRGAGAAVCRGEGGGLVLVLVSPRDGPCRYRALSGACLRALRLELLLVLAFFLHPITAASHLCEQEVSVSTAHLWNGR